MNRPDHPRTRTIRAMVALAILCALAWAIILSIYLR